MRARILYTAAMCLVPMTAWAQDGLRSASLPERPLSSAPSSAPGDLFLAGPDAYVPRPNRRSIYELPPVFAGGPWYIGDVISPRQRQRVPRPSLHRGPQGRPQRAEGLSGPADTPDTPTPAAAPGPPKTFYVIAGCYAGDRPPMAEWLPHGCDLSNVRAVGP